MTRAGPIEQVRVATFNILHGAAPDGTVRLGPLADACAELGADVLGLQEVDRWRRRSGLRDESAVVARRARARRVFGAALHRGVFGQYGNALIARGTVDDVQRRRLPGASERQPRTAILARVALGDVVLSVAVTHLQHQPRRLRHLPDEAPRQLAAVLAWLAERPAPRVLLGDLNLPPPRAEPILTTAGFTVATTGPTYPAHEPRVRVDYVAVQGARIQSACTGARAPVSDHLPVIAELQVGGSLP